jgi:phenylacetate-CoA ligase
MGPRLSAVSAPPRAAYVAWRQNRPVDIERLSFEEQLSLQEERLAQQIERVRAGSPFYRERLSAVRSVAELAEQPFVTKTELLAAQAEEPPLGPITGVPQDEIVRLHVTSGTTGTPLLIGFTRGDLERSSVAGARAFRSAGVTPNDTILHCVNYAFYAGGIADHMSLEATGATVVPVGLGQSDRLLDLFASLRPTGMFSITSYANHLAGRATAKGIDPSGLGLRTIVTGGEPGGDIPEVRARIETTWGAHAADTYGLGEVWPTLGAQCEVRDGFHFSTPDLLVTELVDPETDRALDWEPGATGELVYTHLDREASPLVRFRSRDRATVLALDCPCGRGQPRFRLLGRVDDMIVVRGVNVFPSAIERLLAEAVPAMRGFAVVLDEPIPAPPIAIAVEADEIPEGLDRVIRERLQVQVAITALPPGTMASSEQKTKRIWRRYAGEDPGW